MDEVWLMPPSSDWTASEQVTRGGSSSVRGWTDETLAAAEQGAEAAGYEMKHASRSTTASARVVEMRFSYYEHPMRPLTAYVRFHGEEDLVGFNGDLDRVDYIVENALLHFNHFAREDERAEGASNARLSIAIEHLVADALADLERANSNLRFALDRARIEVSFLRGQLLALREASAMDRRPITRHIAAGVGAVLLALVGGATGGAAQEVTAAALAPSRPAVEAPMPVDQGDDVGSIVSYLDRCEAIVEMLDDQDP